MLELPKTLKTKLDYERCHTLALELTILKDMMAAHWQSLLDTQKAWVPSTKTPAQAKGKAGYKVMPGAEEGEAEQVFELQRLANPLIDQLGFTEAEVAAKLTELE